MTNAARQSNETAAITSAATLCGPRGLIVATPRLNATNPPATVMPQTMVMPRSAWKRASAACISDAEARSVWAMTRFSPEASTHPKPPSAMPSNPRRASAPTVVSCLTTRVAPTSP